MCAYKCVYMSRLGASFAYDHLPSRAAKYMRPPKRKRHSSSFDKANALLFVLWVNVHHAICDRNVRLAHIYIYSIHSERVFEM